MESFANGSWNDFFSHAYVEEAAAAYPETVAILNRLGGVTVIPIAHYKDVFSPRQNFSAQKNFPKLILAVKNKNFCYRGSPMCVDYGYDDFFYASQIMNCPYDCGYCYLRGLYTSANIVAFVNLDDAFAELTKTFANRRPIVCLSYDTDMLALEQIFGFTRGWINYAAVNKNVTFELRTKSANFNSIADVKPIDNFIFAWTLLPEIFISKYEKKTPGLAARIKNILRASEAGWRVRLCFDPLLYAPGCADTYRSFIAGVFNELRGADILDVCLGPFRAPKTILRRIEKTDGGFCDIYDYPFVENGSVVTYRASHVDELYGAVASALPNLPVYFWN